MDEKLTDIIKACCKAKVSSFRLGDFEIIFQHHHHLSKTQQVLTTPSVSVTLQEELFKDVEEVPKTKEEIMDELLIDDPLGLEEMVMASDN